MEILTDLQIDIEEPEVLRRVGYKRKVPQGRMVETVQKAVSGVNGCHYILLNMFGGIIIESSR